MSSSLEPTLWESSKVLSSELVKGKWHRWLTCALLLVMMGAMLGLTTWIVFAWASFNQELLLMVMGVWLGYILVTFFTAACPRSLYPSHALLQQYRRDLWLTQQPGGGGGASSSSSSNGKSMPAEMFHDYCTLLTQGACERLIFIRRRAVTLAWSLTVQVAIWMSWIIYALLTAADTGSTGPVSTLVGHALYTKIIIVSMAATNLLFSLLLCWNFQQYRTVSVKDIRDQLGASLVAYQQNTVGQKLEHANAYENSPENVVWQILLGSPLAQLISRSDVVAALGNLAIATASPQTAPSAAAGAV